MRTIITLLELNFTSKNIFNDIKIIIDFYAIRAQPHSTKDLSRFRAVFLSKNPAISY